jgi:hypothetical protein
MARQRPPAEGSLALTDWLDPSVWSEAAKAAKTVTTIADVLMRMRNRLARKKKTKRNLDELQADLTGLINVLSEYVTSQTKYHEAWLGLLKTVASDDGTKVVKAHVTLLRTTAHATKGLQEAAMVHERRLKAIEEARHPQGASPRRRRRRRST